MTDHLRACVEALEVAAELFGMLVEELPKMNAPATAMQMLRAREKMLDALTLARSVPGSGWQEIETAPKDGTWILGCNDRGNRAVIIWSTNALRRKKYPVSSDAYDLAEQFSCGEGWIFPFTHGEVSPFWEEGRVKYWQPLPEPPLKHQGTKG